MRRQANFAWRSRGAEDAMREYLRGVQRTVKEIYERNGVASVAVRAERGEEVTK
jgi:hypothetical protein